MNEIWIQKSKWQLNITVIAFLLWSVILVFTKEGVTDLSIDKEIKTKNMKIIGFDKDKVGEVPKGFSTITGKWKIVEDNTAPSKPNVLAQTAKNHGSYFNIIVTKENSYSNLELSVKMKSVAGNEDQGGGLVWRYKDIKNYYIARYNPLEKNIRVYKVLDGKRIQLQSANIDELFNWHEIKIEMEQNNIRCYLDGKKYLDVKDDTFKESGRIGFWTKADAVTYFDSLIAMERQEKKKTNNSQETKKNGKK